MKLKSDLFLLIVLIAAIAVYFSQTQIATQKQFAEQAFFCPEDNCAQQLIEKINASNKSIHAAVYSFTSKEIADAMIEAKKRGVEVKIVTDFVQAAGQYSKDELLKQNGIEVKIKKIDSGSMHDKFIVIDDTLAATGSFNYTENADERNDENLVFLVNPETVAAFEAEFQEIWQSAG